MPNTPICSTLRKLLQSYHMVPRRLQLLAALITLLNPGLSFAGECLTSDKELYDNVVASYAAAKKGDMDSGDGGWGMQCWSGNEGLDAKLRAVLTDMLFDSRIHPAQVSAALNDYESVFGDPKALLSEVRKKQGPSRYAIISAIRENKGAVVPAPVAAGNEEAFPMNGEPIGSGPLY